MIVVTSDVVALSTSLSWWEDAEYLCAGLVVFACVGEFVADFTIWFTRGEEAKKRHLAKYSTLLLVASLSLELLCLVRTNILSSLVIGSLGDQAGQAREKAKNALDDSNTALERAKSAKDEASTAAKIAGVARQEADLVERDLIELKAPRTINSAQYSRLILKLKPYAGTHYVLHVYPNEESILFSSAFEGVLHAAGWTRVGELFHDSANAGIEIFWVQGQDKAAETLNSSFSGECFPEIKGIGRGGATTVPLDQLAPMQIMIGSKPTAP